MKNGYSLLFISVLSLLTAGCVNSDGRFRPIDPLGRAIFDALDGGPQNNDRRYVENTNPSYSRYDRRHTPQQVWIEGAYARDSRGGRVWVPGHWARG